MSVEEIQDAIYLDGSIGFLRKVHDALINIAKDDPTVAALAEELEQVIIYQQPSISQTVHDLMFAQ